MNLSSPLEVAAGTAWGENRAYGILGLQSVLNVVWNRAAHPRWWGTDVLSVCRSPDQFSCWNSDDPNYQQILRVTTADPEFALALGLAAYMLAGKLPDVTGGADSYFDPTGDAGIPSWATTTNFVGAVAGQRFYRVELGR